MSAFSHELNNLISTSASGLLFEQVAPTWPAFEETREKYAKLSAASDVTVSSHYRSRQVALWNTRFPLKQQREEGSQRPRQGNQDQQEEFMVNDKENLEAGAGNEVQFRNNFPTNLHKASSSSIEISLVCTPI